MSEPPFNKKEKLDYDAIDRLETISKRLEGIQRTNWVDSKGICSSCSRAFITRQASRNTRVVYCKEMGHQVPEDISECNMYRNLTTLSLGQMADIATLIDPRPDKYKGYL